MNSPTPTFSLDPYHQARLDLWHSASIELSIGPESADPLVQASIEAVLTWLRGDDSTPDEQRRTQEKDDARVIGENPRYSRLYAIDVDSHRVRRLTDGAYSVWAFSISPDSRTVAFDRSPGVGLDDLYRTDLYVMPMNGGEPRPLIKRAGIDRSPLFSPDGKSIAFMSAGGTHDWLRENALHVVSVERGAGSPAGPRPTESRPYVESNRRSASASFS